MTFHEPAAALPPDNSIETLAGAIQRLPADIRWLHARPDVILAMATGVVVQRGTRTRVAAGLLRIMSLIGLGRVTAYVGSLCLLFRVYLQQLRTPRWILPGGPVFVGVGALREPGLVRALEVEQGLAVSHLNETDLRTFAGPIRLGLAELVGEWRLVARAVARELAGKRKMGLTVPECRISFLTQAHLYTYFRAWFRRMLSQRETASLIVFSAASSVAFSAVAAGTKTAYHIHGFQRQSLVFPDFARVRCFTRIEARHMARRLPEADIRLCEEPAEPIRTDRALAIAGCYGQTNGFDACEEFIAWAARESIPVIIRMHPLDSSGYFLRWKKTPNVTLLDASSDFDAFLERYRPRALLSWYSTALFDALRRGIVPVTVSHENWRSLDTVFPFRDISLQYPQDRHRLAEFISRDDLRDDWLALKRSMSGIRALAP